MNLLRSLSAKKDVTVANREKWLSELRGIKNELASNEILFNMTSDFDLTDYTIHQKTAHEARYSYLIRLIRTYDDAINTSKEEAEISNSEKTTISATQQ